MKLTNRTLDNLVYDTGRKDRIVFDVDLPDFGVRVTDKGSRTWLIQYRATGVIRRMKLGSTAVLTPETARVRAKALLGRVAGGGDPFTEAQTASEAAHRGELEADDLTHEVGRRLP